MPAAETSVATPTGEYGQLFPATAGTGERRRRPPPAIPVAQTAG